MPTAPPQHRTKRKAKVHKVMRKQYDKKRGTAAQRGYGSKWRSYSIAFRRANPICQTDGCLNLSEHVDHIKPVNGKDDLLFWDEDNHQALCKPCHSRKTVREDGGFGRIREN